MRLNESGEMYLETLLILSKQSSAVRSIDIAEYMEFSKPSVSRGIGLLKKSGHVEADKDGHLTLTEKGQNIAEKIYERHTLLTSFLIYLGVDSKTATADACKIEHHVSDTSFEAIKKHASKMQI